MKIKLFIVLLLLAITNGTMVTIVEGVSITQLIEKKELPAVDAEGRLNLSKMNINSLEGLKNVSNLENVRVLDLSGNLLTSLRPNDLVGLHYTRELILDNNKIKRIYPKAFKGMRNLEILSLNNNRFKELNPEVFMRLQQLKELSLLKNRQLTVLEPGAFRELPGLRVLKVDLRRLKSKNELTDWALRNRIKIKEK